MFLCNITILQLSAHLHSTLLLISYSTQQKKKRAFFFK